MAQTMKTALAGVALKAPVSRQTARVGTCFLEAFVSDVPATRRRATRPRMLVITLVVVVVFVAAREGCHPGC
jgi:hypothetical protein